MCRHYLRNVDTVADLFDISMNRTAEVGVSTIGSGEAAQVDKSPKRYERRERRIEIR